MWKWKVPNEDVERCEVEWTGHPDGDGTAEVTVSPGGEWQYPITGLPPPVGGVGTRIGLRVRTIVPDLSPWEPEDDYVWGETGAPDQLPAPMNLRETYIGATEVRYAWDRPEGYPFSRIRLRWTRATGGTAGPIDGYLVRRSGQVVVGGALAGSDVTIDVQAGEAAEGPWSAAVSRTTSLFDPARRPDDPTNMQAVAEIGGVRLSCDLPPGVRFARFQWDVYLPGQADAITHSRVVEGDSILVPGFARTRIVGRAWELGGPRRQRALGEPHRGRRGDDQRRDPGAVRLHYRAARRRWSGPLGHRRRRGQHDGRLPDPGRILLDEPDRSRALVRADLRHGPRHDPVHPRHARPLDQGEGAGGGGERSALRLYALGRGPGPPPEPPAAGLDGGAG